MKEKAVERHRLTFAEFLSAPVTVKAATQVVYLLAGFLCSRGIVFSKYAPFGVAAVAAAPFGNLAATLLGVIAGCMFPTQATVPIHYIAAALAAAAIRWTLNDLAKLKGHPIFAPIVAFAPILATGIALSMVNGTMSMGIAMYVAEALLAAGGAYFFARTAQVAGGSKGITALNQQELACVTITIGVLVLSLSNITIGSISIGRVIAIIAILFAARYGGVAGGGIAGIASGTMLGLSTAGLSYLSGAYALGGLMAGVFCPVGRVASVAAFIVANAIASLQVGNQAAVINGLYEVMAATLIYMVWPAQSSDRLTGVFTQANDVLRSDGLRHSVIMKLDYAAKALDNVSESVEAVSKKLAQVSAPDMNGVYQKVMNETCSNCGLKIYCWERNYDDSMHAFNDLTERLRENGKVTKLDFGKQFAAHCSRMNEMTTNMNRFYGEFLSNEAAERRVAQIREVVAEQFGTTSQMLTDMSKELELYERFDFAAAQRVHEVLHDAGIVPIDVSCRVDRFDRMSIEIEAARMDRSRLNKAALTRQISHACSRVFEMPCISTAQGKCRLQMCERPIYRAQIGSAQHVCGNAQLCGDSYECFHDGCGRQIAIISDGMGTGGRAAVDGAMASGIMATLIKAGIGFDCALKIVNSALLVKSGDESLATLDLAVLDLFSGKAELFKAGAPISILCKSGKSLEVDAPALPVGILNESSFAHETAQLDDGDLLVLFSDGVIASGNEWLCNLIANWKGQQPQELAEEIVSQAIIRRSDGHDDDVTALVLKLVEQKQEK